MNETENTRLQLMNSLLQTPHRELDKVYPTHKDAIDKDPLFYRQLAAWAVDGGFGTVRDHNEIFILNLITHSDQSFRDTGLAMFRELPPYQMVRVLDYLHGKHVDITTESVDPKTKKKIIRKTGQKKKVGLGKNIPRSVVTEVTRYLREREAEADWFDSCALTARKYLKRLYGLLHIAPSERAQAILFDDKPPEGSKLADLKDLVKLDNPSEQAKLIIEKRIPYRVASTVVKNMTPTVLLALIEVMTPQELINNMGSLKKRGVFDNADLKKVVEEKLVKAKGSKKVAALKSMEAVKIAGLSDDLNEKLQDVASSQVKSKGRITRSTALLIDKSGSMDVAIEIGKQIGSMISTVMEDGVPFYCYAFDTMPYKIEAKGTSLQDWTDAFKNIRANNGTCCGAGMVALLKNRQVVEQIIMVTDEGENTSPAFLKSYQDYCAQLNVAPSIHIIRCGRFCNLISEKLERAGVELMKHDFNGDYYSLPSLIPYLMQSSRLDLLMEIMSYKLPERKNEKANA